VAPSGSRGHYSEAIEFSDVYKGANRTSPPDTAAIHLHCLRSTFCCILSGTQVTQMAVAQTMMLSTQLDQLMWSEGQSAGSSGEMKLQRNTDGK
jgi:hypothetical protein